MKQAKAIAIFACVVGVFNLCQWGYWAATERNGPIIFLIVGTLALILLGIAGLIAIFSR